eukprot:6203833-Pleurochrysis_carterae.AAC.6
MCLEMISSRDTNLEPLHPGILMTLVTTTAPRSQAAKRFTLNEGGDKGLSRSAAAIRQEAARSGHQCAPLARAHEIWRRGRRKRHPVITS